MKKVGGANKKPYGHGSGGDWTVKINPLHNGVKKQDTLEEQVARQNNFYKDGPVDHTKYVKKHSKHGKHGKHGKHAQHSKKPIFPDNDHHKKHHDDD
jgi:hypothetical protein